MGVCDFTGVPCGTPERLEVRDAIVNSIRNFSHTYEINLLQKEEAALKYPPKFICIFKFPAQNQFIHLLGSF